MAENINSKELCLVVLGEIDSSKTSVISCLLGQKDTHPRPRTVKCTRHKGEVRGRKLTVVDTPGWWKGYPLEDTSQRTKDELVLSVRKCPPGPHAFILAIEVTSLIERNLRSAKEHLMLFDEDIWKHTIVVFTRVKSLNKTIEEHIEGVKTLKRMVEKCGNRYCVFDEEIAGQDQVIQPLDTIEALVDSNGGRHFQMNEETLREVDERKEDAQQKASERQLQVQEKRKHLWKQKAGVIPSLSEVRIVMLGWVVSGKTAARNTILNKDKDVPLRQTNQCETGTALVDGRHITVVDTPSWWKFFSVKYTPERVKMELRKSVSYGSKSPHALLLVVPAEVSFLEEQREFTEDHMKMFGDHVWRHTMVLFTRGNSLGNMSIEEHIETEGEPLRWLVEKCGNRYHVFDNINRGDGSQVRELLRKIDELEASLEFCDPTQETPHTEITPSYDREDQIKPEKVKLVEKEWNRMHRELEERVRGLWQESFGSAARGDRSMDRLPDFHDNDVLSDDGAVKRLPVDLPQAKSSELNITSEHSHQHHGLPHPHAGRGHGSKGDVPDFPENEKPSDDGKMLRFDLLQTKRFDPNHIGLSPSSKHFPLQSIFNEKTRQRFEREWGRCNAIGDDRIRGMLIRGTEYEPHKHGGKEMEEWACHKSDVMERVQAIISEICSKSVFSSEPDEEQIKQSVQKVENWETTPTSGIGSEIDPEEKDPSCEE